MKTKRNALIEMIIITLFGSLLALVQTLWLKRQVTNTIEEAKNNVINSLPRS
jgi:cellobiose-specific phosphotransferase system component IIC